VVFKKGGKLKVTVKWRITWQNNAVVDKFIYLTVTSESEEVAINKTKSYNYRISSSCTYRHVYQLPPV